MEYMSLSLFAPQPTRNVKSFIEAFVRRTERLWTDPLELPPPPLRSMWLTVTGELFESENDALQFALYLIGYRLNDANQKKNVIHKTNNIIEIPRDIDVILK